MTTNTKMAFFSVKYDSLRWSDLGANVNELVPVPSPFLDNTVVEFTPVVVLSTISGKRIVEDFPVLSCLPEDTDVGVTLVLRVVSNEDAVELVVIGLPLDETVGVAWVVNAGTSMETSI